MPRSLMRPELGNLRTLSRLRGAGHRPAETLRLTATEQDTVVEHAAGLRDVSVICYGASLSAGGCGTFAPG